MTTMIVLEGFDSLNDAKHASETNNAPRWKWFCAPDSWNTNNNSDNDAQTEHRQQREGRDGKWYLLTNNDNNDNPTALVIYPAAKKDFWQKTYYDPLLIKDDGAFLYTTLSSKIYYTLETVFQLHAYQQFDQAGLCIRLDTHHWIKTGIEVVDDIPRLSCVVTNDYSDWSTQTWSSSHTNQPASTQQQEQPHDTTETKQPIIVDCQLRVHCRGSSFVVQAYFAESDSWEFIRIAHLPVLENNHSSFQAGIFACCPEDQKGGHAIFRSVSISEGSSFDHNADGNLE